MRTRLAVGAVVAALAALAMVVPAQASHSWGSYHWARTSNPFTLLTGDNVDSTWDGYLDTTVSDWTASSVLDLREVTGSTTGRKCRPAAGRLEVCNAAYGSNGWLGLAQIWLSGGHISQGVAKMNDSYFKLARYNTPDERLHVMCQEVGHLLGLGHTSEDGSSQKTCMDYSTSPDSTRPNAHDYAQLEAIYAHLDSTSTVGTASAAGSSASFDERSSWGREVARSADGGHSTFVRGLGANKYVVTEVTWAR